MPTKCIGASMCMFKRKQNSPWEYGIAIMKNTGIHDCYLIVDLDGKPLTESPWDYGLHQFEGCFQYQG